MDKIRKEFKKWYIEYFGNSIDIKDDLLEDDSFTFVGWSACWKLKDKEITELKIACNDYKSMYVKKMAKNKKVEDALVTIIKRDDWTSGECRHYIKTILEEK